ncbi:glycosyltransferase family 2 protein [Taklimakanibacter lacteus]|uniref:glycosyltransferase family 2 protein n=1 Tax=Taklimakanibacter lacteus TaxID=2268456 RepID=UPI000E668B3A
MTVGSGLRDWVGNLPANGEEWRERDEFNAISDRALTEELRPVRQAGPLRPDDIVLLSVVRNEAARLPLFFEHYKKLGITRFLMVDNDSEDATPGLLLAEPSADIFHTTASYREARSGIYWLNGLARAFCIGHWALMADADELLVFDGMDKHDLAQFCGWLDRTAQDRVLVAMVDIYPPGVIGESGLAADAEILRGGGWFDTTGYTLQRRAAGWLVTGGARHRLFGRQALPNSEWISKYALFRMQADTVIVNAHFIWPRDRAPARIFAAFLHLKFLDDFAERSARSEREGQHHDRSRKYRDINEKLAGQPRQVALHAKSREYRGPVSLIESRILLPVDWEASDGSSLPSLRSVGGIDYRYWTGAGRPLSIPSHERDEFEDFSRRAFDEHLTPVRSRGRLAQGEIGLICVLRNEVALLPRFFDHYRRQGVARFFMIDNNSDDGSREALLAEPLADIFHARALFTEGQGGLYWAHAVARQFGEGNWLVRPDADELFVYDGMEEHDLAAFARWLEQHGMDRVYAPMIDLYPSSPLSDTTNTIDEMIKSDSWFDNDGYSLTRWPQGWRLLGGPRYRLFHQDDSHRSLMWKYPFFQMRADTIIYNEHWLWPHDQVTTGALGAVVHLKLMHDFINRSRRFEQEGQHWNNSNAYRAINRHLDEDPQPNAFYEGSKRYRGPRSLVRHGMMIPIAWDSGEISAFTDQHEGQEQGVPDQSGTGLE